MTLNDFEKFFEEKILQRARSYSDAVLSLEEVRSGEWEAEVEGSENYIVTVWLDGVKIIDSECDCPYDFGQYCKHQGAVFYALRDRLNGKKPPKNEREEQNEKLRNVLTELGKDELVTLLAKYAKKYEQIEEDIWARYSDEEPEEYED